MENKYKITIHVDMPSGIRKDYCEISSGSVVTRRCNDIISHGYRLFTKTGFELYPPHRIVKISCEQVLDKN